MNHLLQYGKLKNLFKQKSQLYLEDYSLGLNYM